jgi:uncharacterized protein (UPF0332 family)
MKEQKALIEKAAKYIRSAGLLLRERDYDSSVSRSYYAMFYVAEAVLLTKSLKFSSHKSVISLFGEHFVKTGIFRPESGRHLRNAFDKRLLSDYSFATELSEDDAREVLNQAKGFVEEVKDYLAEKGNTLDVNPLEKQ